MSRINGLARQPILYVLLTVTMLGVLSVATGWAIEHDSINIMAMARSMATYQIPPMGGSHLLPSHDAHFSLYLLIISSAWNLMGDQGFSSLYFVFAATGVLGTGLFVASLYLFCLRLYGNRWFATSAVLVALLAWGPLQGLWAGNYSLAGITISGMLPQTYGFAFGLLTMILVLGFIGAESGEPCESGGEEGEEGLRGFTGLCLISALIALTGLIHLLSLIFLAVGFLSAVSVYRVSLKKTLLLLTSWAPCILALALWPYYSLAETFGTEIGGSDTTLPLVLYALSVIIVFFIVRWAVTDLDRIATILTRFRVESLFLLLSAGFLVFILVTRGVSRSGPTDPLYIGIIIFGFAAFIRKPTLRRAFLVLWAGISLGGYGLGQVAEEFGAAFPYFERYLFFATLPLHLLLAEYLVYLLSERTYQRRLIAGGLISLILGIWNVYLFSYFIALPPYIGDVDSLNSLASAIPQGAIVVSDHATSRVLAGYHGVTVLSPITHEELFIERNHVISDFFNVTTPLEVLETHVMAHGADLLAVPLVLPRDAGDMNPGEIPGLLERYGDAYREVFRNEGYRLYMLRKAPAP